MQQNYQYFVEGKTEEKIVGVLKTIFQVISPGKVRVFNVIEREISKDMVLPLRRNTNVVLVFDTDTNNSSMLCKNIDFLKNQSMVKRVICIPQVKNLEEEILRSCNIREIKELLSSKSNSDFKNDLCRSNYLNIALQKHGFIIDRFWSSLPSGEFSCIPNDSKMIKLKAPIKRSK